MRSASRPLPFRFDLFGRTYQFHIETPDDLARVLDLDEAHWMATTAPVSTLNADTAFLHYLDADQDGRIQAAEVKSAIRWLGQTLLDQTGVQRGETKLKLSAVNPDSEAGAQALESAAKILGRFGISEPTEIALESVQQIKLEQETGGLDRPGLVLPGAAPSPRLREFLEDITLTVGGEPHPSGTLAVSPAQIQQFLDQGRVWLEWFGQSLLPPGLSSSRIMPLGADTTGAFDVYERLRGKIDQFFLLADLHQIDPTAVANLREQFPALAKDQLDVESLRDNLKELPLAWPGPEPVLDLAGWFNWLFAADLQDFRTRVAQPILRSAVEQLRETDWDKIKTALNAHAAWRQSRPEAAVGKLGPEKLADYVRDDNLQAEVQRLVERSYAVALDLEKVRQLEKLILFQSQLLGFVNSFVSFPDLYSTERRALFEMGTLIMDGRHFNLAVRVIDRAKHAKFSEASNMFVLYAEISARDGQPLYEVAVPVTSGNRGNLQSGKWGIFRDRQNQERHAQIVGIVENPISLGEALLAPFKRLGKAFSTKLSERALKAETQLESLNAPLPTAPTPAAGPVPALAVPATARDPRWAGSLLAGGGIAAAAMGSSLAFMAKTLTELGWKKLLAAMAGAILAVLIPVLVVALMKLARRDLSAILEGSGWGLNARMRLTRAQARAFTTRPPMPGTFETKPKGNLWVAIVLLFLGLALAGLAWYLARTLKP